MDPAAVPPRCLFTKGISVGAPRSISRAVRAGDNHSVAVGVAHPTFPVIRAAIAIRGISMARHYNLNAHFRGALYDLFEILDLKPKQYAIAVRPVIPIPDRPMVVFHFEAV